MTAPTAENAEIATDELAQRLSKDPDLFKKVGQPDSGEYFERNGLLFNDLPDIKKAASGLISARPILSNLAADPSLRGIMKSLSFSAELVRSGKIKLDQLVWSLTLAETYSE